MMDTVKVTVGMEWGGMWGMLPLKVA